MPTSMNDWNCSGLAAPGNMGHICIPMHPILGAPSSTSRNFLSARSGSALCRMPVSGSTLGNLHLDSFVRPEESEKGGC